MKAYRGNGEFWADRFEWLDLVISIRLKQMETLESDMAGKPGSWILTAVPEASSDVVRDAQWASLWERLENKEQEIRQREHASQSEGVFLALPYLGGIFGLTDLELRCLTILLAVEADRKYESAFSLLQREDSGKLPTVHLVASLIGRSDEEWRAIRTAFDESGVLNRYFIHPGNGRANPPFSTFLNRPLQLDRRVVRFLLGTYDLSPGMRHYAELVKPGEAAEEPVFHRGIQEKLRQWISRRGQRTAEEHSPIIVSLWGPEGSGKKTQILQWGRHFAEPLLVVDMAKSSALETDMKATMSHIMREAFIQQAIPVLTRWNAVAAAEGSSQDSDALAELAGGPGLIFLLSETPVKPGDRRNRIDLELEMPELDNEERLAAWKHLAGAYPIDAHLDWEALSARFLFRPGQMEGALKTARNLSEWNSETGDQSAIGWRDLIQACYKQLHHRLSDKSKRLSPKNVWDDLVLPVEQKDKLRHACNHIEFKHKVYDRWGFDRKLSYGTGISLLFSGPPGTGKTMASEIVAKELEMEIYKIDLSQIISKYIGETEKNLKEIFDEAQQSYAVLFFDEADAVFGKRSEVKDSHDKNANTEVAFLLQKMEEYRGISILATNYLQNMDEAFLRRINYVIRFPFPDDKQREVIWKRIFPEQTPLADDVDFGFLARKLHMAGGSIKNIALTAAFLASRQDATVGMKHIFKAYQYELDKTNRALTKDEMGEYAYLHELLSRL